MKFVENICHRYRCKVAFPDTDASGRVHFSRTLIFAELAEHDYLQSIGIPVFEKNQGGWPRAKVACEYKRPLEFGDSIEVLLALEAIGVSSLCWKFEILKIGGEMAAFGEMVTVKVDHTGMVIPITASERKLLEGGK